MNSSNRIIAALAIALGGTLLASSHALANGGPFLVKYPNGDPAARGIPARLHFANVRNHIGTEELERILGTDLLVFHGYTELFLEGRWVAATPAFNKELCEHLGVAPLEFDGREDSIFQQFDNAGGQFMEYVHDYGAFATIPYALMIGEWRKHYPVFRETNVWPSRHA